MELLEEFGALVTTLELEGIDYAVCGGLALAIHGLPRATKDIDLLLRPEDLPRVRVVVGRLGFDLEAAPMHFASSGMDLVRVSKAVERDVMVLDLLLVNAALESSWHSRLRLPWGRGGVWVVSRDVLISLKLAAGRPQDLADIARLRGGG
ncbi:MAG: hypothetical protein HY909_02025 [Deltaproteobacteria bacterium]|nr:hypothetical protein [Deltaproteobacteria bacterium]